jgi:pimeloyl-ACP methyl ester carboxylesterase
VSSLAPLDLDEGIRGLGRGEGEGVLWLHPYALDAACFEPLWDLLPGWRHVGADLPGHGRTDVPAAGLDFAALADRLLAIAQAHDLRHVVGLSFGARVALQMAIQASPPFASVVLGSPVVEHGANDELFWKRYRELCGMQRIGGVGEFLRGRLMLVSPSVFDGARSDPPLWQRLWDTVGRHSFADLETATLQHWGSVPQSDVRLHGVASPILLVRGGAEGAASRRYGERLVRVLRDCRRVQLVGAGALSLLERAEASAEAVETHLAAHARAETASALHSSRRPT